MIEPPEPAPRWRWLLLCLAAGYAVAGMAATWLLAPRVPYADPWRFLANFLSTPFPANALQADNGHREVLPNLVRIAELHWLAANQSLQLACGTLLLLLVAVQFCRQCRSASNMATAAAVTVVAIGIYWLGNARKLAHGNEILPLALVLAGLWLALRAAQSTVRRPWQIVLGGTCATLSFGSGAAVFAAALALLLLRRAHWRELAIVLGSALVAIFLLRHGGGGEPVQIILQPLQQLDQWLRWLGAPTVWLLSPVLDPAHAARLPSEPLRAACGLLANASDSAFGPALAARWPGLAVGGLGLGLWLRRTCLLWRRHGGSAGEQFAFGLCCFGLATGGLVVAVRSSYFVELPDQITTQRYLPWSMLFWTGLALGSITSTECRPRRAFAIALAMAVLFAPSQVWLWRGTWRQLQTAELTALGAAVGVLDRKFDLVETELRDLQRARPLLQQNGSAMYAWPETRWLAQRFPDELGSEVALPDLQLTSVDNLFGTPGQRATATATGSGRLLLLDARQQAVGMLLRLPFDSQWQGWLAGEHQAGDITARRLR